MFNGKYHLSVNILNRSICRVSIIVGNTLTFFGCLGLLFGLGGLVKLDDFAIGISSGIRVIGTVAIAGCLLSAIGYGFLDYIDKH
ncbi:MAG: hypothetical protein IPP85_16440 [Propionivibrio sp.]|nr:hypothetical protein [Propionivibrio sp.]